MSKENPLELSKEILNMSSYERINYKKSPHEILQGQAASILHRHNLRVNDTRMAILAQIIKIVADFPEGFDINESGKENFSANLGKLIHQRVNGLSESNNAAQQIIKAWMSASDVETFTELYLRKILRFNKSNLVPIKVPLNDLINLLLRWNYHSSEVITAISTDYFYQTIPERNKK